MTMKIIIALFCIMAGSPAAGEEAYFPISELVSSSNLVITGTLDNYKKKTEKNVDYESATLTVKSVLKGNAKINKKIHLSWSNAIEVKCPRIGFYHALKKEKIWFLRVDKNGNVKLYSSQQCHNLGMKKEVVQAIKDSVPKK